MLPISVCIIAKNEAHYLHTCLTKLKPYNFELIVVDTGSTDDTVSIAQSFTPHVHHFTWCNDFSAARNFSISKASNDWILAVDCDEYLTTIKLDKLLEQLNQFDCSKTIGRIHLSSSYISNGQEQNENVSLARLFSKSYFHFEGTIHEQIVPIIKNTQGIEYQELPLHFFHEGYSSLEIIQKKNERNIILLEQELEKNNQDPYLYFQLGQSYFTLHNYEKALFYFTPALSLELNPLDSYVQILIESYGYTLLHLKQFEEALSLEGIYDDFATNADFVFLMGHIYMNNALLNEAIQQFNYATTFPTCRVTGVNSYSAFYNMGVIYECTNQINEAKKYYKKAKNYPPALARLKLI